MTRTLRWRAQNKYDGRYCPHYHHSEKSALRCGDHIFGAENTRAVRWYDSTISNPNGIRHVEGVKRDMTCGIKKKKKKRTQSYRFYRKSDIRGVVRFDDEEK